MNNSIILSVKKLSLNEETRRKETKEYDNKLLSLENKRRIAKELPAYASVEEWRRQTTPDEDLDSEGSDQTEEDTRVLSEKDPILYEVGNILADYMSLNYLPLRRQAQRP